MRHRLFLPTVLTVAAVVVAPCFAPARAAAEEPTVPGQPITDPPPPEPAAAPTAAPLPGAALLKVIGRLRETPIGAEQNSIAYLDRIVAGHASAAQVNDFAAYLAKRGMPKLALGFQDYALDLDPENPKLWLNLGTIRRAAGSLGSAATAFKKSITFDPGSAMAHYSLGSVYDAQKHYDAALEEYRSALVLDPDLADPRKNPQVVNNDNLLAVKLQIYHSQAGSMGLPLLQMQATAPAVKPAPEKQ